MNFPNGRDKMEKKKKIGIMGGTFNPIHTGHLLLAENAYETMQLEEVWMMPTAIPPHKRTQQILAKEHRLRMVQLAIEGNAHFRLSYMEMDEQTHYSYKTMETLKNANPETEFFFILGADSLFSLEEWVEFNRFLSACHILVAVREGSGDGSLKKKIEELKNQYQAKISMLTSPKVDISSTEIRQLRSQGRSIRYYVPEEVYQYIEEHQLYLEA